MFLLAHAFSHAQYAAVQQATTQTVLNTNDTERSKHLKFNPNIFE